MLGWIPIFFPRMGAIKASGRAEIFLYKGEEEEEGGGIICPDVKERGGDVGNCLQKRSLGTCWVEEGTKNVRRGVNLARFREGGGTRDLPPKG